MGLPPYRFEARDGVGNQCGIAALVVRDGAAQLVGRELVSMTSSQPQPGLQLVKSALRRHWCQTAWPGPGRQLREMWVILYWSAVSLSTG